MPAKGVSSASAHGLCHHTFGSAKTEWKAAPARTLPNHKFLRSEQLAALMDALSRNSSGSIEADRNLAFFGLIFFGPSRLSEIRLLDCADIPHIIPTPTSVIPAEAGIHHFQITIRAENAKNGQARTFPLSQGSLLGGHDIFGALL